MDTFDELRDAALEQFDRLARLAAGDGSAPEAARRSAAARDRLRAGHLTTALVGEFKRGKSTLLCALLDEPGLFPADTLSATNAVTTVRWGLVERIVVSVEAAGGQIQEVPITRDRIAEFVTEAGNPGNRRRVVAVHVELPNRKLASGLAFVDTPGVGGIFSEHTAVTLAFLPGADALVFVTDVEKPVLQSELAFLRRAIDAARLTGDEDSVLFVMTKIDQGDEYRTLFDKTRSDIAEATGMPEPAVVLIPVSSWLKLDHLADEDPETLAASNFLELESALWTALGRRRVRVLIGGALRAIREEAHALLAPIEAAEQAAADATGKTLDDLLRQSKDRRDYLDGLTADSATWPAELTAELNAAQAKVVARARQELEKNWNRFLSSYTYDGKLLGKAELMRDQLAADLAATLGGLLTLVRREVAKAVEHFASAKNFTLDPPDIDDLPDLPDPALPEDVAQVGAAGRGGGIVKARYAVVGGTVGAVAGTTTGAVAGAIVGAVFGSLILPGVGTAAGASAGASIGAQLGAAVSTVIGTIFGYRSARKMVSTQQADTRRSEFIRVFTPSKANQDKHVQEVVKLAFDQIRPAAVVELDSRLKQERETVNNKLKRLAEQQRNLRAGRAADAARYAAERQPLDEVLTDADGLAARVDAFASTKQGGA